MNSWHLIFREISHRRLTFVLSVGAVAFACACVIAAMGALRIFDQRTDQLIAEKVKAVEVQSDSLQEAYRKIGTEMGFNILILPKEQNLGDMYANDYVSHFMPEKYVRTLSRSNIITIRHLLPTLQQKVKWPEEKRTIILVGASREVPLLFDGAKKKPLREEVPPGKIVLGYELHALQKLAAGAKIRLMGREFTIMKCRPEQGTKDDITAWVNLNDAQELLDKKGMISGVMALECNCAMAKIDMVRKEIEGILPQTQVIEFASKALARAETRRKAADYAKEALAQERISRLNLRDLRERFLAAIMAATALGVAFFIGFLSFVNMRERRFEVGILRAVGMRTSMVIGVFMGRAVLAGLGGATMGVVAGLCAVAAGKGADVRVPSLTDFTTIAGVLIGAPFFSAIACWIPVFLAAYEDPADIFMRE